ncbi:malonic semialdehyde reductase [Pelagibacterales bacterium]|nr:malonic semialdehyde reductase [Pelagibacterales bacterium]
MNEDIKRIFIDTVTTYNFSNKEIGDEVLKELYELTKWGATSFNCSPLRLVFLKSEEAKNRIDPYLMDANKVNVKKAPVCVIIGMDTKFFKDLPKNFTAMDAKVFFENNEELAHATAFRNSSLQAGYFLKAVNALGLDTGAMSGFDNKGVDNEFFKDTSTQSNFLCTLGYGIEPKGHPRGARYNFDEVAKII